MAYLVFDAGGTFTKYALMNEKTDILERGKFMTPDYTTGTKEAFISMINEVIERYKDRSEGIAISMPGMLDSDAGYCVTAGYLAYLCGTPLAEMLSKRHKIPVTIENDGKCAALAEFWKGSLKGCTNGAVLVLGSGVGGGLIIDKKLYKGRRQTAGEFSYVAVEENQRYELDGYWGMKSGFQGFAKRVAFYTGEDWEKYDGLQLFQRAATGDEKVLKGLKDFTDSLALQVCNLNMLLDLDVVAVGGGISCQPLLHEYLQNSIDEYLGNHPMRFLSPYIPKPVITNCKFYNDANLIGALYHFLNKEGGAE